MQLTYQAAVHGVVDFSKAEPYEKRWQQHLSTRLLGVLADRQLRALEAKIRFRLAELQAFAGDNETYSQARADAVDLVEAYCALLQPWLPYQRRRQEKQEVDRLTNAWEEAFGKLSDPNTQRGIRETVEGMIAMRQEKRAERQRISDARKRLLDAVEKKIADRQRQHRLRKRVK